MFERERNPLYLTYADAGWAGMSDWLGNGIGRNGWRPFEEARAFVRKLGLNSSAELARILQLRGKAQRYPVQPAKNLCRCWLERLE